jgi:hypothetical protein
MTDEIDYAPAIAGVEHEIERLQGTLATLRALAAAQGQATEPVATAPRAQAPARHGPAQGAALRRDQFFGMKAPDAVKAYLAIQKQPRATPRITSDLLEHGFITSSDIPVNTIRTTLKRLQEAGEVVQVKKEWGLTEWYSGYRNKRGKVNENNGTQGRETKPAAKRKKRSKRPAKKDRAGGDAYRAFIGEKMKGGMSMADAAAEWKIEKARISEDR